MWATRPTGRCWCRRSNGSPQRFGLVPAAVTADRGYGDAQIEADLAELGVETVAIPRKGKPSQARRDVEQSPEFHRLVKWRTGSEGRISYLKRRFGWDRTLLDGLDGAQTWCGLGRLHPQHRQDRQPDRGGHHARPARAARPSPRPAPAPTTGAAPDHPANHPFLLNPPPDTTARSPGRTGASRKPSPSGRATAETPERRGERDRIPGESRPATTREIDNISDHQRPGFFGAKYLPAFRDFARNAWPLRGRYTCGNARPPPQRMARPNPRSCAQPKERPMVHPGRGVCVRFGRRSARQTRKPQVRRPMVPVGDEVSASVPTAVIFGIFDTAAPPPHPTSRARPSRGTLDRRIDNLVVDPNPARG